MKWSSPAKQRRWEWHSWFAWHPVRMPENIYEAGYWVWWERIERCYVSSYACGSWEYRESI